MRKSLYSLVVDCVLLAVVALLVYLMIWVVNGAPPSFAKPAKLQTPSANR